MSEAGTLSGPDERNVIPRRLARAFHDAELTGLKHSAIARTFALTVIMVWLFFLMRAAAWFYLPLLVVFCAIPVANYGLARSRFARDWYGYVFFALDAILLTFTLLYPNPLLEANWPLATSFRFGTFIYFFVLLALVALSYSPRLMLWAGLISVVSWSAGAWIIAAMPGSTTQTALRSDPATRLEYFLDPAFLSVNIRMQEAIVFLVVACVLALSVWRSRKLAIRVVTSARERTNLARYFPPSIVDQLAETDNPFGDVRSQSVAVLFADIVGFTHMAEEVPPQQVVEGLRAFHRRMESAVFENGGTLDKFLGDGVMATFGTPDTSEHDATNALACARNMVEEIGIWNTRRAEAGHPIIRLSVGAHFGQVVLGDIGTERRLEYAVLGDSVNVASRLEELTRTLDCSIIASDALVEQVRKSGDPRADALLADFSRREPQRLRGREAFTELWSYGSIEPA